MTLCGRFLRLKRLPNTLAFDLPGRITESNQAHMYSGETSCLSPGVCNALPRRGTTGANGANFSVTEEDPLLPPRNLSVSSYIRLALRAGCPVFGSRVRKHTGIYAGVQARAAIMPALC